MKHIIADTNFLLIPAQFKIDVFSEISRICDFTYKIYVVDKTIDEIEGIAAGKGKDAMAARLGLQLLKAKDVGIIKTKKDKNADDLIVDIAKKGDIVATQDIELKRRVKKKGAGIITMRQKRHLILA